MNLTRSLLIIGLILTTTRFSDAFSLGNLHGGTDEVSRDKNFAVVRLRSGQSIEDLAAEYLGAKNRAWQILELNNISEANAGQLLAIPLKPANPSSVYLDGYRTVPILCYHQFSPGTRASNQISVSERDFDRQMAYLAENNFQVIRLAELEQMLDRKLPIPPKAVAITIDDGYRSIYNIAYPILKKYNLPATIFLYTDFVGGSAALSWEQLRELKKNQLIDIQSHTRTHTSLAFQPEDHDQAFYQNRVRSEIFDSERALKKHLGLKAHHFAYPYGDSSYYAVETLRKSGYSMALTVKRGGNPTFSDPHLLRRTMIYNDHTFEEFKRLVTSFTDKNLQ